MCKNDCPRTVQGVGCWGVYSLADWWGSLVSEYDDELLAFWLQAESSSQMAKLSKKFAKVLRLLQYTANPLKTIQTSKLQIKTRELLCIFSKTVE